MGKIIEKLRNVLNSNVLIKELICVPKYGATDFEIEVIEKTLAIKIDDDYREILQTWDGLDLDVIRIFSTSSKESFLESILQNQNEDISNMVAFGSDPAGFLYLFDKNNCVFSYDHDGGTLKKVANTLEEFICDYVFGSRATEFAGEEWLQELKDAGLV